MATETRKELFHDAATGETFERELTAEEIAALPKVPKATPPGEADISEGG